MTKNLDLKNITLISIIMLLVSYLGTKLYLYSGIKSIVITMDIAYLVFIIAGIVKVCMHLFKDDVKLTNKEVLFILAGAIYTFSLVLIQESYNIHLRSLILPVLLIISSVLLIKNRLGARN